jgi:hypothetical protein
MRSPKSFLDQQGYFTFAQNTESVNYLELAYAQAASIKQTQKINKYAVAVDSETKKLITDKHQKVFDYVVDIVDPVANAMGNEWQAWQLTPFKETIKLESDILFTTNVDHWWTGLRLQEVCFTTKVRDYFGRVSKDRSYRKFFDENNLPDVYTGMYYFRFGQQSLKLFQLAFAIYSNWEYFRDNLKNCREELPSTDVVFAIAARLLGVELCTNPALDYPSFVHMKGSVNHLHSSANWQNILQHELNGTELTINFNRQLWPVHYYQKDFINEQHRKELARSIQ